MGIESRSCPVLVTFQETKLGSTIIIVLDSLECVEDFGLEEAAVQLVNPESRFLLPIQKAVVLDAENSDT
jgi:hypothetical protein